MVIAYCEHYLADANCGDCGWHYQQFGASLRANVDVDGSVWLFVACHRTHVGVPICELSRCIQGGLSAFKACSGLRMDIALQGMWFKYLLFKSFPV
jgi:hypothetical protein